MIKEYSVGAVVYNADQFLTLKYGLGHWGLVKGHKEEGETDKETIIRELKEETGISNAKIIKGFKERFNYHYKFKGNSFFKTVSCYLIKTNVKEVKLSYEHSDYKWLPYDKAIKEVTFDGPKVLIKKAKEFLSSTLDNYI